ncbi:MAM and LDL-receptor class A domain-containing protein 1 isoform X1 [Lingula anatina]|uniref:Metalloendopeptidase n=1 Tax=Lingula anatina TaxID=7574 RepID=A0A1S3JHT0_LINAN|nr:MAM and LDL-receptor class A domain-containing protein 1 isoform X1 [Lingula anatina]|eukprot:XP_013409923.1 MAM and LDL-receptor class A domain-containing protein 1 isoform X1 [Lingula anatina]
MGSSNGLRLAICAICIASAACQEDGEYYYGPYDVNPEEGDLFEGDIVLEKSLKNAVMGTHRLWPNGVVPYEIDPAANYGAFELSRIQKAIDDYNRFTCIRWINRTTEKSYVQFIRGTGCSSSVGRSSASRSQRISLSRSCFSHGAIVHEMMHALGFYHEQSRADRDDYVTIMYANIEPGKENNFKKYSPSQVQTLGAPYDYGSLMHYGKYSFSKNAKATIVPKDPKAWIGQRSGLSTIDKYKINKLYNCTGFTGTLPPLTTPMTTTTTALPPNRIFKGPFSCNFDKDTCSFTQDVNDDQDWTRFTGKAPSAGVTGPTADHTNGTGHYMYYEASRHGVGDVASLRSPGIDLPGTVCLEFWYYMFGHTLGQLDVYTAVNGNETNIFVAKGSKGNRWLLAQEQLNFTDVTQLVFKATRGNGDFSDIAIDDISVQAGKCITPTVMAINGPFHCDFERDCGFTQSSEDDFDWSRHRGKTASANTGPNGDHANGKGYYMYTEVSGSLKAGNRASMATPPINLSGKVCISFRYHMYGNSVGELNVYTSRNNSSKTRVFAFSKNQGNVWKYAQTAYQFTAPTQVIFEGVRGANYDGDIAIDDIHVVPGDCPAPPSTSAPTTTRPTTRPTSATAPPSTSAPTTTRPTTRPTSATAPPSTSAPTTTRPTTRPTSATVKPAVISAATTTRPAVTTQKAVVSTVRPTILTAPFTCNFDKNVCGFTQSSSDQFDWTRHQGNTSSPKTGPSKDHTTGSGYYMYIEASSPQRPNHTAIIHSPTINIKGKSCISYWFHMYGGSMGRLTVSVLIGSKRNVLFTTTGDKGNMWIPKRHTWAFDVPAKIEFQAICGPYYASDIAIDDVSVTSGPCPVIAVTTVRPPQTTKAPVVLSGAFNCNFDKDTCGFTQDKSDTFDWTRQNRTTSSANTGPMTDHTTKADGHYMYIETSNPRQPNDAARLISPVLTMQGQVCINYWYHMYGFAVGAFNVFILSGGKKTALLNLRGNMGNQWRQGQSNWVFTAPTQLVFEAIRGSSYTGDIAIDDISVNPGPCPTVAPTTTMKPRAVVLNCDFSKDLCGFVQSTADNLDWLRRSGSTPSSGTGPTADHTTGSAPGNYLFIEATGKATNDSALITSPNLNVTGTICVSFWYHMYGVEMGYLKVYRDTGVVRSPIMVLSGNKGNKWLQATITLTNVQPAYKVAFQAIRGRNYRSDVAIDDISITEGTCSEGGALIG